MNSTAPTTKRHLRPRTTVISGAALGLVVGATVYGAVSSSAEAPIPKTFKAKAPVAVAPASAASCAGTSKLEKGVCVVHVVRTVVAPRLATVAAGTAAVPMASHVPSSTVRTGASAGGSAAAPKAKVAPKAPATPVVAPTKAPVSASVAAPAPAPTKAPVPGATPAPTATPVPTAAS